MLTQDELKREVHYDEFTGIFTRLIANCNNVKVGDVAGSLRKDGYIEIRINGTTYLAHRLAWFYMTGGWPNKVDHDDHVRDNNIWTNLNGGSTSDNSKNQSMRNANTSGFTGVYWHKPAGKLVASIKVDGKNIHLGYHEQMSDAVLARITAEEKHGFHPNHGTTITNKDGNDERN